MSSAEALASIREYVSTNGEKYVMNQVRKDGDSEIAGLGIDQEIDILVEGLSPYVFPNGVLSGRLACRAVLLEPDVTDKFVDIPGVNNVLHLRTRLDYKEPHINEVPDSRKALIVGGPVIHIAALNLLPEDGEALDVYYTRVNAQETGLREGTLLADDAAFLMPTIHGEYVQHDSGSPNFGHVGPNATTRAAERLPLKRAGFIAMQAAYPATRVLKLGTQGYVSENELSDWADAFTEAA